jgi:hypothetical protein
MADEIRTDTPGLARRVAGFEVEDVYIHLVYDPRLRFYIPKRWWVNERFDISVHSTVEARRQHFAYPHLEVDVGERKVTMYRPREFNHITLAVMAEVMEFARAVLLDT